MKTKRLLAILFVVALMTVFTACGGGAANVKTLSDVYGLETEDFMEAYDQDYYACYYTIEGTTYRAEADMPEGLYDQIDAISFDDETRDDQIKELLGPVEVKGVEDVTALMPSEDDVNALVGKTGKELMDDGYEFSYFAENDGYTSVSATKGYVAYLFDMDGVIKDGDEAWKTKAAKMKVTGAYASGFDYTLLEPDFEMPE